MLKCVKKDEATKIKGEIKIKNKNKNDYINKEHAYKIFLGGDKYSKNIKGLGGVRTAILLKSHCDFLII